MLIDFIPRMLIGGLLAGVVAGQAARRGHLTPGGAYAAFAVGTAAAIGGAGWALSLVVFFVSSVALSEWRRDEKQRRSERILPDARARDAWQVLANGGWFAIAALVWGVTGSWQAALFGFGALAAATADTWATEVGMALKAAPRSLATLRPAVPGTSGAVSAHGVAASVVAAFVMALCAVASLAVPFDVPQLGAVLVGGVAGAFADSVLGATVQARRWCETCREWTERRVHPCGDRSHHRAGLSWMTNDVVNALATGIGGGVAAALWHV